MSNMNENAKLTAVDLFCGCGGISAGLRSAGFDVLAGFDVEPKYMTTFAENFGKERARQVDLAASDPAATMDSLDLEPGELTLLAGGPPCQGFSKNVPRSRRESESDNNCLLRSFLDHCETMLPRIVLMENVAEMRNGFGRAYTDEAVSRLTSAGYTVSHMVLNAADYGVPQRRRRAFFLANRMGFTFREPDLTHVKPNAQPDLLGLSDHVTVWEAIGDLPSLHHGEGCEDSNYATPPSTSFQRWARQDSNRMSGHVARPLQPRQFARLNSIAPGQGHKDLPDHLRTKGGYSGAYGRLTKDMIAPTITRWVFHPGSGRWGHPVDIRTLSIREIARIQGFPDSYAFVGSFVERAGQLGNAVPPLLIEKVVLSMLDQILDNSSSNFSMDIRWDLSGKGNRIRSDWIEESQYLSPTK